MGLVLEVADLILEDSDDLLVLLLVLEDQGLLLLEVAGGEELDVSLVLD